MSVNHTKPVTKVGTQDETKGQRGVEMGGGCVCVCKIRESCDSTSVKTCYDTEKCGGVETGRRRRAPCKE